MTDEALEELELAAAQQERDEARTEVVYWKERTDAAHQIAEADRIELRALRALIRWVMANPSRCIGNCCGELGAFTVYHASEEDEISEDGSGPTAVALADALGLKWREP